MLWVRGFIGSVAESVTGIGAGCGKDSEGGTTNNFGGGVGKGSEGDCKIVGFEAAVDGKSKGIFTGETGIVDSREGSSCSSSTTSNSDIAFEKGILFFD
jgi:hypothetical protein